jgi:hypothetical protein
MLRVLRFFGFAVQPRLASQARHKIVARETFAARIEVHAGFVKVERDAQ